MCLVVVYGNRSRLPHCCLLQQLNREHGKTIVMVTHDPKAAEYASVTLTLDKGNLVTNDDTDVRERVQMTA